MKWKSLRQVNCFQLCRESNEKWSLYYICMLKGNYWFQICNNEISLLMGYKIKLYENKSNKCAFSHIRRNAILQAARSFCFQAFVHIRPINYVKNPSICVSDQGPLSSLSPGESSLNLFFNFLFSNVTKSYWGFLSTFLSGWIWDMFSRAEGLNIRCKWESKMAPRLVAEQLGKSCHHLGNRMGAWRWNRAQETMQTESKKAELCVGKAHASRLFSYGNPQLPLKLFILSLYTHTFIDLTESNIPNTYTHIIHTVYCLCQFELSLNWVFCTCNAKNPKW